MDKIRIKPVHKEDQGWISSLLEKSWGSIKIVTRGKIHLADSLPGFIAILDNNPAGLVTYNIADNECEIITLDSLKEGLGIGSALIEKVKNIANGLKCKRLWLITTNDNTKALCYYQKKGFTIKSIYPNALEVLRKLKPEIPLVGVDGIPLKDEIELEMKL